MKNIKILPALSIFFILSFSLPAAAQLYNTDTVCRDKNRAAYDTLVRCEDKNDLRNRESNDPELQHCAGGSQGLPHRRSPNNETGESRADVKAEEQGAETEREAVQKYGIEDLQGEEFRISGTGICSGFTPSLTAQVNSSKIAQKQNTRPQDQKSQEKRLTKEDIDNQKIAYFTKELKLTPEEAAKFWPLYYKSWNERTHARRATMRDLKKLNDALKADPPKSEAEIKQLVDAYLKSYGNECALIPKYFTEFSKVLPLRKTAKIFQAEENFRIILIRQLRNNNH